MQQTRKRRFLIAFCSLLFACIMGIAVAQVVPAKAAEEGVLDGNTAEYTIVNDSAHPWVYERGTNTWYNNKDSSNKLRKVLTINITSSGSISFKYKANLYNTNTQGKTPFANRQNDFYLELTKGGVTNTIVALHGVKMPEYEQITIDNLSAGDKLVFTHKLAGSSTTEDDRVYVQGLNKPAGGSVTITANVSGNGKITCDEATEASVSKTVVSGSPVVLTAKPDSGNVFAYWTDSANSILSYEDTLNLSPLATTSYTAHFVAENINQFTSHEGWEQTDNGYKLASDSVAKKVSTLTYEFIGEKYLYFEISHNLEKIGDDENEFETFLNGDSSADVGGELPSFSQYNNFDGFDSTNPQFGSGYIHVTGDGYHRLDFVYAGKDGGEFVAATKDYFEIKEFNTSDTAKATTTITLDYEKEYGTVYIDGAATDPGEVTVPKGVKVMFTASINSSVQSKIDSSQHVAVRWDGFYTHEESVEVSTQTDPAQIWPDPSDCGMSFSEEGATGNSRFKMTGHYIKAKMREYAAAPQVSLTAQIDGIMGDEETLMNGQQYEVKYGSNVNISVLMKDFPNIQATYHVKINDVETDTPIAEDTGRKMFSLNDITADTKVTVYYSAEGYYDSAEFTFTIAVVSDATVEKDLLIDGAKDITAANDEFVPWEFSAEQTDENGTAFVASNSGLLGYYGKAVSSLKFTVDGAGTLEFDFKIIQASYWLIYGDKPVSITDTLGNAGKKDSTNETVWWINREDKSWNRIIARGSTSQKEVSENNYMYWFKGADYDGGKTYTLLEDGWAHVSIPVGEEGTQKDIYVSYFRNSDGYTYSTPFKPAESCDYAAIRNVGFFKGKTTVNYSSEGNGTISATSGGNSVGSGTQIAKGGRITFKASANEGNQFYGWTTEDGKLISSSQEFTTAMTADTYTIKAVFGTSGQYIIRNDGKFYDDLQQAINAAKQKDRLIVLKDFTVSETLELPAGVSLVLPVNERGDDYELGVASNSTSRVPWSSQELISRFKNFTLTVATGQTLTIKGSLFVGAVEHHPDQYAQGLTSGKYNVLDIQGNVVVDEGGHLDVRGLVTGEGGITVKKGGKLTQPFMILDYSGGTNTQDSFNAGVTPFKMYAMVNIQCKGGYTVEYGGELWGHASLFFWGGTTTIDTPFITWVGAEGDSENALLILKAGAKVTSIYDDSHQRVKGVNNAEDVGKTTMTATGGAKAGFMQFPLGINTSGVYFSLPYNYELILKADEKGENGDYDVANNFKLMPGSVVRVEEGATLNVVGGKGLHVYDSFFIPNVAKRTYPTGTQLTGAGYQPYASLIVNGTLNIQDGATFLGTVQTTGTNGKIVVGETATLSASLFDGVSTQYSCNYTMYTLTAQVYDAAHKCMGKLEAGKTYTSVLASGGWTLPGIAFQYETKTGAGAHGDAHTLGNRTTDGVTLETGSWKVEHGSAHNFDWTITDEEKNEGFFGGDNHKTVSRKCTELGCPEEEHKTVYKPVGAFENQVYNGSAFDVETFFTTLFEEKGAYQSYQLADGKQELKDAGTYSITVTLDEAKGYFLVNGEFKAEATFSFEIDRKVIDVTVLDQSADYTGEEPTVSQGKGEGYTAKDLCEGDTLGISITKDAGANYKEGGYALKAAEVSGTQFSNKNYAITFKYTSGDHSVFTVNKVTLTVKADNKQSPKGEALQPFTVTVTGYVHGEENLLHEKDSDLAEYFTFTCSASTESDPQNYDITVKYIGEAPLNYTIAYGEKGTYTITEAVFAKVKFENVTATYDGAEHALVLEGTDNLADPKITYTYDDGVESLARTNAGTYRITVKITVGNYNPYEKTATLTIEKRDVHVTLLAQEKDYDGTVPQVSSDKDIGWKFADGSKMYGEDQVSVLGIALSAANPGKNAGSYDITAAKNDNGNYNVIFDNNGTKLYTIQKKAVTVQIESVTMKYGEDLDSHKKQDGYEKAPEGVIAGESLSVTLNFDAVQNKAGEYDITGTADPATGANINYTITVKNGKFTINARTLTVVIEDQSTTYDYQHAYSFDANKWHVKENAGDGLAKNEEKGVLNVTLTKPELTDVGEYEIAGTWNNDNYTVTFEGTKGQTGVYTVKQKDVGDGTEDAAVFLLLVGEGGNTSEGERKLRVKLTGESLNVTCTVKVYEGTDEKTLNCKINPAELKALGEQTVTVTIEDKNYKGSAVFTVVVTDAEGYTPEMREKLQQLETLAEGMDAEALKAEDFQNLKEINALLSALSEEEREALGESLEPYDELVAAWHELADLDEIIETAEAIGNAPIRGLYEAAAVVSALAVLGYIVMKGGLL